MYREELHRAIEQCLVGSHKAPDLEDDVAWRREDGLWSQADHGANPSSPTTLLGALLFSCLSNEAITTAS